MGGNGAAEGDGGVFYSTLWLSIEFDILLYNLIEFQRIPYKARTLKGIL